ncbi:MAG TPA: hypothetical protein VMV94_14175 [Phycisphaerae bacterium]|nr:hypothetical protein [Phycisphaerae bacterium]
MKWNAPGAIRTRDLRLGNREDASVTTDSIALSGAENPGAHAGAQVFSENDRELALVVTAWPTLSEAIKAGILAIVNAAAIILVWHAAQT